MRCNTSLGGFQRLPLSHPSVNFPFDLIGYRPGQVARSESPEALERQVRELLHVIDQATVKYSDLPAKVRASVEAVLQDPDRLGNDVVIELKRCLDARATSDIIRTAAGSQASSITLSVGEQGRKLWHCNITVSDDRVTVSGGVEDMELIGNDARLGDPKCVELLHSLRQTPGPVYGTDFLTMTNATPQSEQGTMHYLPAARSGIMQSYRVIAGSIIARSTRGRFDRALEVPSLSGVVADFMQRIALYDAEDSKSPVLQELAGALEQETLTGQIGARTLPGGYSDFAYRPLGTKQDIRFDARVVDGLRTRSRGLVHERRHPCR